MKMRDSLYAKESVELIRTISLYKSLTREQVYRLFPGKQQTIKNLLTQLIKQKRLVYNPGTDRISAGEEYDERPDCSMITAFWVLLDFMDKTEYHTASDFPVKISFFSQDEFYEIVYVPFGQEIMISHAMATKEEDPPRRLVVVDNPDQISNISIRGTVAFCVVSTEGKVNYYKLE